MFRQSVSEILEGLESAPPPGCEMGPKSPALLGLRIILFSVLIMPQLEHVHVKKRQVRTQKLTPPANTNEIYSYVVIQWFISFSLSYIFQ